MTEDDLRRLLHDGGRAVARTGWRCPDATRLAAHAEHRLPAAESTKIEAHLADCPACLEQVAFLVCHPVSGQAAVVPQLLSRALALAPGGRRAWPVLVPRWAGVALATVCLLLVVTIELRQPDAPALPGVSPAPIGAPSHPSPATVPAVPAPPLAIATPPTDAPTATVRKSIPRPLALHLLSPSDGSTLSPGEAEFRWRPVAGTAFYEIQVMSEDGDVVWQTRAEATSVRLPAGHALRAGTKYFVWVRAHLTGGGSIRSAAVAFRFGAS